MDSTQTGQRPDDLPLEDRHYATLAGGSGILPGLIKQRGYRTVNVRAELRRLGFSARQALVPTLVIPVKDARGDTKLYQHRPDDPRVRNGKIVKYETPSGASMGFDVHPSVRQSLRDPGTRLFITEGVKKGDCLVSHGEVAIALLGVWNYRGTNEHGGKTALADWDNVALNGRDVFIAYDSDISVKPQVAKALMRLKSFLESREAHVKVVYLPDDGDDKTGVDDFLVASHSIDDLLALATDEVRVPAVVAPNPQQPEIIVTHRHLHEIASDATNAIVQSNGNKPQVFRRGGTLARLSGDEQSLESMSHTGLKGHMDRVAKFRRFTERGDLVPARPPDDVVADILETPDCGIPEVKAISTVPLFLPEGSLVSEPGFHARSGTYLFAPSAERERAPMAHEEGLRLLGQELLVDFPFADQASATHAVCMFLQPFVRLLIEGPSPLYLIDAPMRGTGKTLLAVTIGAIALGKHPSPLSQSSDESEVDKRITAILIDGTTFIFLDNISALKSRSLASVLTSTTWSGRMLGHSRVIAVPNNSTWVATGNNVALSDELARRVVPIRLDAVTATPETRSGFAHPLPTWALRNRRRLIEAGLSLVRHWISEGRPAGNRTLGMFESWAAVMGGIAESNGLADFLANRGTFIMPADAESAEWDQFVEAWHQSFGVEPVLLTNLVSLAVANDQLIDLRAGRNDLGIRQRLGRALLARRDRVYTTFRIRAMGRDSKTRGASYRLQPVEAAAPVKTSGTSGNVRPEPVLETEVSEVSNVLFNLDHHQGEYLG
jgi:hypothetical protein